MSGKTGGRGKPSGKTIDDTTDEAAAQAAAAQQRRAAPEGEASETAAKEAAFDPEADLAGTAFDPAAPDDLDDDDLDDEDLDDDDFDDEDLDDADLDDDELDAHARDQRDDQARDSAEFAQDQDGPSRSPALPEGPTRCGFVALIGAPNAGKSTLTNALVGTKVSIVSHKVQTTRAIVRGIALAGSAQLILVDTPGIFSPKRRLERAMVSSAWTQAADADVVALLVDAKRGLDAEVEGLLQPLANIRRPRALILNKIDLIRRDTLLELASRLTEQVAFERVFMISALTGDGIEDVKAWFAQAVPFGPWLYPEDQISDAPMRMLAAEITREKMFVRLHDELPYRSTVETESWKELRDGSVRIEQTIFVERESQRKIVLGKGGATIKAISSESRAEISEIIEQKVHLFLFVKVRENWADDPERYREMGLEFPKG